MDVVLSSIDDLHANARADVAALSRAVYPPEVSAAWPGRHLEWSVHESAVLTRAADGQLIGYAGLVVRSGLYEGRPVRVGGIGGVKTHPTARRQGCAARAVQRALAYFHECGDIGFALLVCEPHVIDYYRRLGWQEFLGCLLVTQHSVPAEFTLNRVMVCAVHENCPSAGTIDLQGPPW